MNTPQFDLRSCLDDDFGKKSECLYHMEDLIPVQALLCDTYIATDDIVIDNKSLRNWLVKGHINLIVYYHTVYALIRKHTARLSSVSL